MLKEYNGSLEVANYIDKIAVSGSCSENIHPGPTPPSKIAKERGYQGDLLYSQNIWWGIKFGGLVVCLCNRQIKIRQ